MKDWYELINEAETVIDNGIREVSVKFVQPIHFLFHDQVFANDIKSSIINLEFTKHVEELDNEITGPVIINYSSFNSRMESKEHKIKILQKTIMPCPEENQYLFGGHLMLSCYHIGALEKIHETYVRIERWTGDNGYILGEESFERYATDYWTTSNTSKFVTEILIKVSRPGMVESCQDKVRRKCPHQPHFPPRLSKILKAISTQDNRAVRTVLSA